MKKATAKLLSLVLALALCLSLLPAVFAESPPNAAMTVDLADRSLGPVFHGASAALYALSEPNVPDINTLIPLKPSHALQKAPNGIQHPSGDALRTADYFFEAGGKTMQIYMQDHYYRWYYNSRSAQELIDEAIAPQVTAVLEWKAAWKEKHPDDDPDERIIYVPWNEPDQDPRYGGSGIDANTTAGQGYRDLFNQDWLMVYNYITSRDPGAKFSAPNHCLYRARAYEAFIMFAAENDCVPDYMSWHLLQRRSYNNAAGNLATYRSVEANAEAVWLAKYGDDPTKENPFPLTVDINEYADPGEIAMGGALIQYIARYDELKIMGALPYWNTANSFGSLMANQNHGNGAWWLYKWYAELNGDMAKITVNQDRSTGSAFTYLGLYGMAAIDDDREQVGVIFGGNTGGSDITFDNVTGNANSPAFLEGAEKVHATVLYAGFTGLTGYHPDPTVIFDGDLDVVNGSVKLTVDTEVTSSYYVVLTPAAGNSGTTWHARYEAEDAVRSGSGTSTANQYPRSNNNRSASNGTYVTFTRTANGTVTFTVDVPADGSYRLDLVEASGYTANAPAQSGTSETSQRLNSEFTVQIDNGASDLWVLPADYSISQLGTVTKFVDLTEGTHTIAVSKVPQGTGSTAVVSLDCLELTYNGVPGSQPTYRVQAEYADYDTASGLRRAYALPGFDSAGYISFADAQADATLRFVTAVQYDGMYNVTLRAASAEADVITLTHDRVKNIALPVSDTEGAFQDFTVEMYLRSGINIIDVNTDGAPIALDYIESVYNADSAPIFSVEAEDCFIQGTPAERPERTVAPTNAQTTDPAMIRTDVLAKYASGGAYVNGITSFDGQERYLEIRDINVPADGLYNLVVTYANGESSGSHSYNNNIVERFADFTINGEPAGRHHFKQTISWQQFGTMTFTVELKVGDNTIRFANNGGYDGGSHRYYSSTQTNPTWLDESTPYVCVPYQYTPAFDKFEIYPAAYVEAAEPVVTVRPDTIVSGYAANLPVTAEYEEGQTVTAWLADEAGTACSDAVTLSDGAAVVCVASAPSVLEDTVYYVLFAYDGVVKASRPITVTPKNNNLWKPLVIDNTLVFAEDIALTNTAVLKIEVMDGSFIYVGLDDSNVNGNILILPVMPVNETMIVSGIKYPKLFPSYSFTFTLPLNQ